jgi:CIC family chloride channel protein
MQLTPITAKIARWVGNDHIILGILSLIVGVIAAYAAIGFRLGIDLVQSGALGFDGEDVFTMAAQQPWWRIMLAPTLGGLAVGLILHFFLPEKRIQGVPHVIEAMALRAGYMRLRDGIFAALASVIAIGSGSSTGREGPMVHLGATLTSYVAARLHLGPDLARIILGCGVASAVAASFNAPIAGVFFALEVIIGRYAMATFAPVVIAGVAGTVISRIHLGEEPAFILPEYAIVSAWEYPAFLLLGVVCAIIAVILMRSIFFAEDVIDSLKIPPVLRPALGGLAIGALAVNFPQLLGVGYEGTDAALKEAFPLWFLIALIMLKTAATAICIGCRFGGGIFSPSLFLGALTGGAYGLMAAAVFPELAASHGAYAIVGMSALAGAMLGAPISTIFIVFELIGDYKMTIATMLATATAALIASQMQGGSYFRQLLLRRGIDLDPERRPVHKVKEALREDYLAVGPQTSCREIQKMCQEASDWNILVLDGEQLLGALPFPVLRDLILSDPEDLAFVIAADLMDANWPRVTGEDTVENALLQIEEHRVDFLPVIAAKDNAQIVGIVRYRGLLRANHDD